MKILRRLLWLLPEAFRREYGADLVETAREHWSEVGPSLGLYGRIRFWGRQWFSAIHVAYRLRRGGRVIGEADEYARRRDSRGGGIARDLHHAARGLIARPYFTCIAVSTLGLGVGVATTMFSTVNAVLLRPLPYDRIQGIVVVDRIDARDGVSAGGVSAANTSDLAATARTLSTVAAAESHGLRWIEDGRAVSLRAWLVSEGFFEAMGARTAIGRTFRTEEYAPGGARVILLGHRAWRTRFGGDTAILGRGLVLDGAVHTVVGVLPAGFEYPSDADVWGPRPPQPWDELSRGRAQLDGVARLSRGAALAEAQAELDKLAADLAEAYPDSNRDSQWRLTPLRQHLFGDVTSPLLYLLGAVGVVLVLAATNVAGLLLARGTGRSKEYALRCALGANTRQIVRLVFFESSLLAFAGGAIGIALSVVSVEIVGLLRPDHLPRIAELRVDAAALWFGSFAAAICAFIAGVAPALRAGHVDLQKALGQGARGNSDGRGARLLRDRLVVVEIALALILSIAAGLCVRSLDRMLDNELGFDPTDRFVAQVWAYDDNHQGQLDFFDRGVRAIRSIPGVVSVGLTTSLPLADDHSILARSRLAPFRIEGDEAPSDGLEPLSSFSVIDDGYAAAMGLGLRAGRGFSNEDNADARPVAIVNETFVRRHFPDGVAVGRHITLRFRDERVREIVGVFADVRRHGFASEPEAQIFLALSQEPSNGLTFVVKTDSSVAGLGVAVQDAIWDVDPTQAIWASRPMTDLLWRSMRQRRFATALLVSFAVVAIFLAAVGVYGLMSFSVAQRVGELGVRRALGGRRSDILRMVLTWGLELTLSGCALGLVGAVALTRLLQGFLYGVEPLDAATFALLSLLVVAVSSLAALVPALRATRVDPMIAMRTD